MIDKFQQYCVRSHCKNYREMGDLKELKKKKKSKGKNIFLRTT